MASFTASPPSSLIEFWSISRLARLSFCFSPSANPMAPFTLAPLQLRMRSTMVVLVARASATTMKPSSPRPFQPRFRTSITALALTPSAIARAPFDRSMFHPRFRSVTCDAPCSIFPQAMPPFSPKQFLETSRLVTVWFPPSADAIITASASDSLFDLNTSVWMLQLLSENSLCKEVREESPSGCPRWLSLRSNSCTMRLSSSASQTSLQPAPPRLLSPSRKMLTVLFTLRAAASAATPRTPTP
mmetsp:Transcript_41333/g.69150  ORF Transcript_41333/g.69150 Transcript_41333/m.69150 type:complete len:244 (-) Transcript_41333:513-1244(-)